MEITVSELKSICQRSYNLWLASNTEYQNSADYNFQSFNSNFLYPQQKPILKGILCLHKRNYRLILVDRTDWVYIEFLNSEQSLESRNSSDSLLYSNNASESHLKMNYLLKDLTIKAFNLCIEHVKILASRSENKEKIIFYLQTEFSQCQLNLKNEFKFKLNELNEDLSISILKTQELIKQFKCKDMNSSINDMSDVINETLEENDNLMDCQSNYKLDLDKNKSSEYFYLIKIVNKDPVQSMARSTLKGKLRANIKVEMYPLNGDQNSKSFSLILALMSKYLYFYNFLYLNNTYLLKTKDNIYSSINSSDIVDKKPVAILYLDDTMTIIDEFALCNSEKLSFITKFSTKKFKPDTISITEDFLPELSGTLIEKRIITNPNQLEFSASEQFLEHYDILIANVEFRLLLKLDDKAGTLVYVYYDTRFLLYPVCILPGLRISVFNLIKRTGNIFKSNSMVCAKFYQGFNFLQLNNESDEFSMLITNQGADKMQERKSLLENLNELDTIFTSFYEVEKFGKESNEMDDEIRLSLLFKNCSKKEGNILKIMGQITKIYDLVLRVKCKDCLLLPSSCDCSDKNIKNLDLNEFNVEISCTFLIDDHTSVLKLTYFNSSYDIRGQESPLFGPVSSALKHILLRYLNEIKMPNIPVQTLTTFFNATDEREVRSLMNKQIYDSIREKIHKNENSIVRNISTSDESVVSDLTNTGSFFEDNAKLDIFKTIYDYISNCVIEKYFVFFVDSKHEQSCSSGGPQRTKLIYSLFNLDSLTSNQQYKSTFNMKCYRFLPVKILN